PDILEVLPGIAKSGIDKIKEVIDTPLIGGGLITTQEDANFALNNGLLAITTGEKKLWNL
ncbi:MAG: glycerol-3-phosphate responsive antiterminator, partial [Bacilli bacterium]